MREIETPDQHTIASLCDFLKVKPEQTIKTLLVDGLDGTPVALVLRGDHDLNAVKAEALPAVAAPLRFASAQSVKQATDPRRALSVRWG